MSHPKIELVRLSSAERRTLPPLNLVQLCVRYTHRRMESYASLVARAAQPPPPPPPAVVAVEPRCPKCVKRRRACTHLSDTARLPVWGRLRAGRAAVKSLESVARLDGRGPAATKSCENILQVRRQPLAGDGRERSPLVWREATRSEEHLAGETMTAAPRDLRGVKSQEYLRKYTIDGSGELVPLGLGTLSQSVPGSPRGLWSKKSSTMPNMQRCIADPPPGKPRRSLSSFLKRLHPRLLRASLQSRASERRPWIVVEFQDVDADAVSVRSDELRHSFSSAHKISLVKSRHSSREELTDDLLDAMRQGRVTSCAPGASQRTRHMSQVTEGSEGRQVCDPPPPPNGTMFSEKELLHEPQLTSARIIMDAQKELRTNGCGQDQVDRSVIKTQRLLQETHTLKTSLKSSEVVKQAVRLLSEEERNGTSAPLQKRPSYVGISCSVSGYSNLNRYTTRALDGQRWSQSRDSSPARGLRSLSRDSSPPGGAEVGRPDGAPLASPSRVSQIKRQLRDGGHLTDGERGRDGLRAAKAPQPRSLSVDRGYLRQYRHDPDRPPNGSPVANGRVAHVQHTITTATNGAHASQHAETSVETTVADVVVSRSFVQARIERLYGPGALCSGFRRLDLNRSLPNRTPRDPERGTPQRRPAPLQLDVDTLPAGEATPPASSGPPVFRHLRAEFRQQLPVKVRRVAVPPADTSPTQTAVPPITAADPPLIGAGDAAGCRPLSEPDAPPADPDKPGHKFFKVLDIETTRILAMATRAENDLNARQLSPEIEGKLRAAKGKAQLLIAQKFQQFRGLCEKNIKPPAVDPFPTTDDDLQGFWDMVLIQVHDIDTIMAELDEIRTNNWVVPEVTPPPREVASASSTPNSKSSSGSHRSTPADPAKAEAARARSAARKRMMEARRRLMDEKRRGALAHQHNGDDVEIFVAEN